MLTDSPISDAIDLQRSLYYAIFEADIDQVSELVSQGIALTHAQYKLDALDCGANNLPLLKALLNNGVISIDDRWNDDATLLHLACFGCPRVDVVDYLLGFINSNVKNAQGETPLHYTLEFGRFPRESLQVVNQLLQAGANPNEADQDGVTPLMLSVSLPEVFKVLLSAGADPSAVSKGGFSVLHRAAMHSEELVRTLLDLGESPNRSGGSRQATPIHTAVSNDQLGIVKALIEYGADVNQQNAIGIRPLNIATTRDFGDIVELMIANGAETSSQDEIEKATEHCRADQEREETNQQSPLIQAINRGDSSFFAATVQSLISGEEPEDIQNIAVEVVTHSDNVGFLKAMVDLGCDLHHIDDGFTLLHDAAINNRIAISDFLLDAGLDPNARTEDGRSMFCCSLSSSPELIELLLQRGMKQSIDENQRPFDIVTHNLRPQVAQWLMDAGFEINRATLQNLELIKHVIDQDGADSLSFLLKYGLVNHSRSFGGLSKLLAYAVEKNAKNIVRLLLENRVDPNALSDDGKPVIFSALDIHNEPIIELLIKHGADANVSVNVFDQSLLQTAIINGNAPIAQLLIKNGANVAHKGGFSEETPLHCSARRGYLETAKMLVSAGADTFCVDKDGKTALDVAIENSRTAVATFLRELSA